MAHPEAASGATPSVLPLRPEASRRRLAGLHADGAVLLVGGLTAVAFVLRLLLMRDSLLGDELIMYDIVHGRGLGSVLHIVRETEKTPPLHFVLAWASAHLGDPRVWIRLPSLLAGTALVPLAYLIGRRTVGRTAGVVGAAILTLQPYSVFYATEARAYATVAFLAGLSTAGSRSPWASRCSPWGSWPPSRGRGAGRARRPASCS